MATMTDVVRRISIVANQNGVDQTAASLTKLASAQDAVTVATATSEKATISMQSKLLSLQKSLDATFASEQKLASIEKTLNAAREQGLITLQRQNELLTLAADKYAIEGDSAKLAAEGIALARDAATGLIATLGPLAALTAIAELPGKVMDAAKSAADIAATAQTIGITAQKLQELDYAAKAMEIDSGTMNSALERFSKNLGQAATGSGALAKVLKDNHIVISGDLTKDFESYMSLLARTSDQEQKNFLSTTAFGKSAEELGRLANIGGDGVARLGEQGEKTGAILSDDTIKAGEAANAEFTKMSATLGAAFDTFLIKIAPAVELALQGITAAAQIAGAAINIVPQAGTGEDDLVHQLKLTRYPNTAASDPSLFAPGPSDPIGAGPGSFASLQKLAKSQLPSSKSGGSSRVDSYARETQALKDQTAALTMTGKQQAELNALTSAGITANDKGATSILKAADALYDQKKALDDINQAETFLAQTATDAFTAMADGSKTVQQALGDLIKSLAEAVVQAELLGSGPLAGILGTTPTSSGAPGGLFGAIFSALIPHALGGVYQSPSLHAFSSQIVDSPTLFKFASGGVMGEAGPEAIMPLKRGADGKLGVSAPANQNGGGNTFIFQIDAKGAEIGVEAKIVQAIQTYVPQMIQSGAPKAVMNAQRDNKLKRA